MKVERANALGFERGAIRSSAEEGARPTVRPPFDPEKFARESDSNLRVLEEGGENGGVEGRRPAPSSRPTVPPPPGLPDYTPVIGIDGVPQLVVARDDLEWFDLTPEARTLLKHVDGQCPVAAISEKMHLPANDVITELERLAGEGLVSWR
jgi:hypothetical protein